MSHRDGDGGDTTASGGDEFSAEDEFRQWAEEAGAGPPEDEGGQGWAARVFGRKKDTGDSVPVPAEPVVEPGELETPEREPTPEDLENPEPGQLGVFRAIDPAEGPPPELTAGAGEHADELDRPEPVGKSDSMEMPVIPPVEPAAAELDEAGGPGDGASGTPDQVVADASGSPAFADLWSQQSDPAGDEAPEEDIVDFANFTSEDYLAATTREYAGLAEAVARAKEEGTQQMAVSAEIPGLESGVVGLDDVMDVESGNSSEDVIEPHATSELSVRVLTAFGLVVLFAASLLSPYGIGALIFVVLGISAGELFAAFIRGGYRPLSIFGFLGIAGAFVGTWLAGPVAIPVALLVTAVAVFLFYATVPGRRGVVENASLTVAVTAWIGGLGAFAFDFLKSEDYTWLVLALVITVASMDIGGYFIGRRLGKRALAPVVSPKKTVEGYIAGIIVAIAVGAAFGWAPPFELRDGLLIGAVAAIVGPVGDLAVSVVKRALGVKDMGYILPGHGGVLDRVDAMIPAIPALWIAYSWMGLLN